MNSRFDELYDKLLLNELSPQEFTELETLYRQLDKSEQKEYNELFLTFNSLALEVEKQDFNSEKVKANILSTINKKDKVYTLDFRYKKVLTAAIILLSFISIGLLFKTNKQSEQLQLLSSELDKRDAIVKVMLCKDMTVYKMKSHLINNTAAYGKVAWSPMFKVAVLQICDLPKLPANQEYQLWMTDNENVVKNLGVISAQSNIDEHFYKINDFFKHNLKNIKQFALTIESKGGNERPGKNITLASI